MSDTKDQDRKTTLSLGEKPRLELRKSADSGQVRQSFSHGRSKTVQVEVKRKRSVMDRGAVSDLADGGAAARRAAEGGGAGKGGGQRGKGGSTGAGGRTLTQAERDARERAVRSMREEELRRATEDEKRRAEQAAADAVARARQAEEDANRPPEPPPAPVILDPTTLREREMAEMRAIQEQEAQKRRALEEETRQREADRTREKEKEQAQDEARLRAADRTTEAAVARIGTGLVEEADDAGARRGKTGGKGAPARPTPGRGRSEPKRRSGKLTVTQALTAPEGERTRSLAAMRRARQKERRNASQTAQEKVIRDVTIPDVITVQELANRMAERGVDVIKTLMKMGVMATINQSLDADTAELVVAEFGHRVKRVSESDIEVGIGGVDDRVEDLQFRAPVVTIMGHVDHGKTSLLDALRQTDVAAREAGGITQHIGAYQVVLESGGRITFIDTPGHEAFSEMRARGANTTDIVVLVVAADDGIMPQTVEAIRHAKAAAVPIIVAINKCDLPGADPSRVRSDLLRHELVVEEMGGEVLSVEVSAKAGTGLDKLEEAILLQAEILDLKANPDRPGQGTVVEAKVERGRGSVATVLIQRGTLRVGDVFVSGAAWGRVRALINDRGQQIELAGPATPVEVLGLSGTPLAGDDFVVLDSEGRAREIAEFRDRSKREKDAAQAATKRGTLEQMFDRIQAGEAKELPIIIKGDVQGSVEAIAASLTKLTDDNTEVQVRVLHSGVGGINESDVTLSNATGAMIIGFNVRANSQAREMARRDGVEIRYYSVIYDVIDDVKAALSGLLSPVLRETFLGNAEIREVFNITKVGKVAGCYITDGIVKRGAKVRLLRDSVVIHEGALKTLKRFKDEVREVREGYECGMAFENYDDIRAGDIIEAFEVEEVARQI